MRKDALKDTQIITKANIYTLYIALKVKVVLIKFELFIYIQSPLRNSRTTSK